MYKTRGKERKKMKGKREFVAVIVVASYDHDCRKYFDQKMYTQWSRRNVHYKKKKSNLSCRKTATTIKNY